MFKKFQIFFTALIFVKGELAYFTKNITVSIHKTITRNSCFKNSVIFPENHLRWIAFYKNIFIYLVYLISSDEKNTINFCWEYMQLCNNIAIIVNWPSSDSNNTF